jgi:carboxymethylenebutenolidase
MATMVRIALTGFLTAPLTAGRSWQDARVRTVLPSGTAVEIDDSVAAPAMGLVIAPDIFGLRPLFDGLVARLARDWNVRVAAVEPFPGHVFGTDVAERMAAMPSLRDDDHLRDLAEAADLLGCARTGAMGFCMGGMYCHKAARSDRFDRIVAFYGMIHVPEAWRSATQGDPVELMRRGDPSRVLSIVGARDPYTPAPDVAELRAAGAAVVEYPDAEHGFAHDAARPSHRADDARDAFERAHRWLLGA